MKNERNAGCSTSGDLYITSKEKPPGVGIPGRFFRLQLFINYDLINKFSYNCNQ